MTDKNVRKATWKSKILKHKSKDRDSHFLVLFSPSKARRAFERGEDSLMLATIRDDTWNVLNMQHITPNSKIWDYSDILGDAHKRSQPHCWRWHHLRKPQTPTHLMHWRYSTLALNHQLYDLEENLPNPLAPMAVLLTLGCRAVGYTEPCIATQSTYIVIQLITHPTHTHKANSTVIPSSQQHTHPKHLNGASNE